MIRTLLLVLSLTTILAAQSPQAVEITAEPHHHLIFENAQLRVFSVDVVPHTDTLLHAHRHDYIYVMFGDSEVINAVEGKPPAPSKLTDGQVGFTPGNFSHIVHNGDHPFRNLTVELLQDDKLRQSSYRWDETRGLDILPAGTKEILFVQDGIRVSEFELQPDAAVPSVHHSYPLLLIAVTDLAPLHHRPAHPRLVATRPNLTPLPGWRLGLAPSRLRPPHHQRRSAQCQIRNPGISERIKLRRMEKVKR